jgi:hypothetical protein
MDADATAWASSSQTGIYAGVADWGKSARVHHTGGESELAKSKNVWYRHMGTFWVHRTLSPWGPYRHRVVRKNAQRARYRRKAFKRWRQKGCELVNWGKKNAPD